MPLRIRTRRSAPRVDPPSPPAPTELPCMRGINFGDDEEARALHAYHMGANKIVSRSVSAHSSLLSSLDILEDARAFLVVAGLDSLIDHDTPTCDTLVYEFMASFRYRPSNGRILEVSFRLGNKPWSFTRAELCTILGFPENGTIPVFNELERQELWEQIASPGTYFYPSVPASHIRVGVFKYIHRLLAFTVFDRYEKGTKVIHEEMDVLVAMERSEPIDMTSILCHRLSGWAARTARHKIFGGGLFISRIAQHLQVPLARTMPLVYLDIAHLVHARFLVNATSKTWLCRSDLEPRARQVIQGLILRLEQLRRQRAGIDPDEGDHVAPSAAPSAARRHRSATPPLSLPEPDRAESYGHRPSFDEHFSTLEASHRHLHRQAAADRASRRAHQHFVQSSIMHMQRSADISPWGEPPASPEYPDPFVWPDHASTSRDHGASTGDEDED